MSKSPILHTSLFHTDTKILRYSLNSNCLNRLTWKIFRQKKFQNRILKISKISLDPNPRRFNSSRLGSERVFSKHQRHVSQSYSKIALSIINPHNNSTEASTSEFQRTNVYPPSVPSHLLAIPIFRRPNAKQQTDTAHSPSRYTVPFRG